jgi:hypothetical protein
MVHVVFKVGWDFSYVGFMRGLTIGFDRSFEMVGFDLIFLG